MKKHFLPEKALLLSVFAATALCPVQAVAESVTDASSRSVAQRILDTGVNAPLPKEFKVVILTPRTTGLQENEAELVAQNVQKSLEKTMNTYSGMEAFIDSELSTEIYSFLLDTSVTNYYKNERLQKTLQKVQYALIPMIYRNNGLYYLTAVFMDLQNGRRISYTKTENYNSAEALYGSFGATEQAAAAICAGLKLSLSENPVFELAEDKELAQLSDAEKEAIERATRELVVQADEAYGKNDFKTALKLYKQAAQKKNSYAMRRLGDMYFQGQGTMRNRGTAVTWYKKAAGRNDDVAQTNLGILYENGIGVQQDFASAAVWYERASYTNTVAQTNLGFLYETAKGVMQDYERAFSLYSKAAEKGVAQAQNNLGVMYENGRGTAANMEKALDLYQKAAEAGNAAAQCNLGILYDTGRGVSQSYTTAATYYQKAADQGNAVAQNNLGILYEYGLGVSRSNDEAKTLYEKAKKQGDVGAAHNLAILQGSSKSEVAGYTRGMSVYRNGSSCGITLINSQDVVQRTSGGGDEK